MSIVNPSSMAEKKSLQIGYLQLNDAAPLLIAQALGFFSDSGLSVTMTREVSWANVRDKLASGLLDAAPMLAPLPVMTAMGVSGVRVTLLTGLVLSRNGNAVTLAAKLFDQFDTAELAALRDENGNLSAAVLGEVGQQNRKLTIAVVHAFSTHHLLLRRWLRNGGLDPDRDVTTLVIPPSQMVDSLKNGVIDGYCVGEPWNTIAVQQGNGIIAAVGASVWNDAPEKLLCVTDSWHARYPVTHLRLRLALMKACNWLEDINHRQQAAEILAGANFLDLDLSVIAPSLTGLIVPQHNTPAIEVTDFYQFGLGPAATPDPELAQALAIESMELLGSPVDTVRVKKLAAACFRPDLYHEAAACFVPDAPS